MYWLFSCAVAFIAFWCSKGYVAGEGFTIFLWNCLRPIGEGIGGISNGYIIEASAPVSQRFVLHGLQEWYVK